MSLLLWIPLAFLLVVLTVGSVHVFRRGRRLWREMAIVGSELDGPMERLTAGVDRLSTNSQTLEAASSRLETSVERLRGSIARLMVLRAAVDDARESLGRPFAVYPRS